MPYKANDKNDFSMSDEELYKSFCYDVDNLVNNFADECEQFASKYNYELNFVVERVSRKLRKEISIRRNN